MAARDNQLTLSASTASNYIGRVRRKSCDVSQQQHALQSRVESSRVESSRSNAFAPSGRRLSQYE